MSFESPGMLFGMLAALGPLIIHLTNRHRARKRPFAALDFLLLSDKRLARRLKAKQILVLALRMLLFAAIPFSLAKPFMTSPIADGVQVKEPGSVAIIIDHSGSMSAVDKAGKTRLELGLEQARELIDAAGSYTNFAVVSAAYPAYALTSELTYDRGELERALARVKPTYGASDLPGALKEAERILARSDEVRRQVALFSDQAEHAWRQVTNPWSLKNAPQVTLIELGKGELRENTAIVSVSATRAPDASGATVECLVKVHHRGKRSRSGTVRVEVDNRSVAGTFQLKPQETTTVRVVLKLDQEALFSGRAILDLQGEDALVADNEHHFVLDLAQSVRVLAVNGSPHNVPYLDELFFLRPALARSDGRIQPTVVTTTELSKASLEAMDVVILANVAPLSKGQQLLLRNFVRAGGGLLISAGSQLTPKQALTYGELLPFPIRSVKKLTEADTPGMELRAQRIGSIDTEHPVLQVFGRVPDLSLFKAYIRTYVLLDAQPAPRTEIIARYANGAPALVEKRLGEGRVALLTTSIDQDWSDFALKTSFLPLVQQLVIGLAGRLEPVGQSVVQVGQPLEVKSPPGTGPLVVVRPDGTEQPVRAESNGRVRYADTEQPGVYRLLRKDNPAHEQLFAVNPNLAESDLRLAAIDAIYAMLNPVDPVSKTGAPRVEKRGQVPIHRSNVWPMVLLALFGLLLVEAVLVVKSI